MDRRLATYLGVSFAFSWAIALWIYGGGGFAAFGAWIQLLLFLFMCGPAVGAIVCVLFFEKGRRLTALGLTQPRWREMPWAWAGVVILLIAALLFTLITPGYTLGDPIAANVAIIEALPGAQMSEFAREASLEEMRKPYMPWLLGVSALLLGPLINWPLMLSEELGWRGYLWDRLKEMGFWRLSGLTGLLWGAWHAPIILLGHNYPTMPIAGVFIFTLFCILFSPLYSWVRITTRSVWGPALMHGTTNAGAGYFLLWQDPIEMPMMGLLGGGGLVALVIANVCLWHVQRKRLA